MGRWFLNFSFNGRARRSHTWANNVVWLGIIVLLAAICAALVGKGGTAAATSGPSILVVLLIVAAFIAAVLDGVAMTFRRAHDTGKSGWIWLLLLVPLVNLLALYWLLIEDSQAGPNKYGPPVKAFYTPPAAEPA